MSVVFKRSSRLHSRTARPVGPLPPRSLLVTSGRASSEGSPARQDGVTLPSEASQPLLAPRRDLPRFAQPVGAPDSSPDPPSPAWSPVCRGPLPHCPAARTRLATPRATFQTFGRSFSNFFPLFPTQSPWRNLCALRYSLVCHLLSTVETMTFSYGPGQYLARGRHPEMVVRASSKQAS